MNAKPQADSKKREREANELALKSGRVSAAEIMRRNAVLMAPRDQMRARFDLVYKRG